MTVRADSDRSFYSRFLLIGAAFCAFALWFLYDGAVGYPAQNVLVRAHEKLNEEGRGNEWLQFARDQGWSTDHPGELKDDADIFVQYIMAGMGATLGLSFFVYVLRNRGKWIESTQSGLTSSWGQSVDFDRVASVDKRQWKEKGIAKITYDDGRRTRRFTLDNYKFDRHLTTTILAQLEARIGAAKVVGGPPEPPPGQTDEEASEPISENTSDLD